MPDLNHKYYFECNDCGKQYASDQVKYLCPVCSESNLANSPSKGVLHTYYDYDYLNKTIDFSQLQKTDYLELLPLQNMKHWPGLRIGKTPLYRVEAPGEAGDFELLLKDDSQNPSFSFKDRASALVSAFAKERKWDSIVAASTGNAGSSIAAICAHQNQKAVVIVPSSAPIAKLMQIKWYGARIIPVKGSYDDAFELSKKASEYFGWYNRNTAYNPLTIEGKKTVAFELFEQLNKKIPDNIFVPVGDGVIISGVYKGYEDLLKLGWIERMPRIIAIQSENSDNLVRNLTSKKFRINSKGSIADSITVDVPRNFHMTRKYLQKYNGSTISVSDAAIMDASSLLAKKYGLFSEPAAATSMAGFLQWLGLNMITEDSINVVLLTGSGLKDIGAIQHRISTPEAIEPDIDQLKLLIDD